MCRIAWEEETRKTRRSDETQSSRNVCCCASERRRPLSFGRRVCVCWARQCFELTQHGLASPGVSRRDSSPHHPRKCPHSKQVPQQHHNARNMAKARAQVQRHQDHIEVHQDDVKEEDPEELLDESADPLEESGRTVDTSDEEIDDSVAEEISRFEDSFAGINKRYRLINRIGEGTSLNWLGLCRACRTHSCRYLLDRLQGGGLRVQQLRQPMGYR